MRLSQKLILFVLLAAVAPLSLSGFWLLRQAEEQLSAHLAREQQAVVSGAADGASAALLQSIDAVAQAAVLIDWPSATPEEVQGGLALIRGQARLAVGALYLDGKGGAPLTGPAVAGDVPPEVLALAMPVASLSSLGERGQVSLGEARERGGQAWLPLAVQVGPRGAQSPVVVVALALAPLDALLAGKAGPQSRLALVDGGGRVLAASWPSGRLAGLGTDAWSVVQGASSPSRSAQGLQVAFAPVPGRLGLTAVATVPLDVAMAPVLGLRRAGLGSLAASALVLIAAALVFVRSLASRLEALSRVALNFGAGQLEARAPEGGADEVAELAQTFNRMGAELETSRARLLRWNEDLAHQVQLATADLRAAQAQLMEAQKLAAIGQLGAGVAHEINNPLCGILGNAQLLMLDHPTGDPDFALLQQIEEGARRCRDVTQNLLRFSELRGEVHLATTDLNDAVRRALEFEQPRNAEAAVKVVSTLADGELLIDGDPDGIQQAMSLVLANARTALRGRPLQRITVETRRVAGGAQLVISDTGKGIAAEHLARVFEPFFTTKDVWTNIGLGLSVVYRLMQEHGGRVEAASVPGEGATFTLSFLPPGMGPRVKAEATSSPLGGAGLGILG